MNKGILGRKLGMTQVFDEAGRAIPVTVVLAGPCVVVQKKVRATDGYGAIQVGFSETEERRLTKPELGHLKKAGARALRVLRELRLAEGELDRYSVGQEIKADVFTAGELIDVTGVSRGKGFAGGVKRHGFNRGPMTHGSKYHRGPGSLSARTSGGGGTVRKGRRMPGRLGGERVTVLGLEVVSVDPDKNLLLIRGAVPGARGSILTIRDSVRATRGGKKLAGRGANRA